MNPVEVVRAVSGWTQTRLAEAAATSQPTIAAYESGVKSPIWRTVERIAEAAGLACYPCVGTPMTRDQARSLALHGAIAAKLHSAPRPVVSLARSNIATMLEANPNASALLDEWAQILELSTMEIASRMLDPTERGRDLRQVTPFAGVLNAKQRAAVYRSFRGAA